MNTVLEWLLGVALRQQINRRVAARTRDIAVESNRIATVLREQRRLSDELRTMVQRYELEHFQDAWR